MTTVSFKLSNNLEAKIVEATQFKYNYPQNIPVIVEKTIDSDVPEIDKNMYLVPVELTVGQFLPELNLGAQRLVFVFVKNTLAPTGALVSDLYDKHKDEYGFLYMTYSGEDILCTAKTSLRIANSLMQENGALEALPHTWMPLLSTLAKLASVSESNQELKLRFEEVLHIWTEAFCKLLLCFATTNDISWIRELKDHTNFDVRNHMMQSLFPYPEQEQLLEEDLLQVVVSRTNLLQESMSHVMAAQKWDFSAGIHVSFKDEQAEGDGVLREWLYLVWHRLFDPQRKLFTPSPDDPRRFSPHPEPLLEENYLDKYRFAGRMITLALKHNMQVGILFDPLFFHHLAGKLFFSLEDLIQTDMEFHKQYKAILEMDGEELDAANGFGLTFSGLWANGDKKPFTSENRRTYISLNIHERYYHKVRDQVVAFSDGVEDLIEEGVRASEFFSLLKLDVLDSMMYGAQEDNIDVDEWRQYTDYTHYAPDDNVILWFWEVLHLMDQEELHKLLCF